MIKNKNYIWWFCVISILILVVYWLTFWSNKQIKVIFCDVGQGDGTLVIDGSFQLVIDVGPENKRMVECLGRYLPFWDKNLEMVVLTHTDRDHVGGLLWVEKMYNIEQKFSAINLTNNDILRYKSIDFEIININQNWDNDNDNSVVGWLTVGESNFLLLADITTQVEHKLLWRDELRNIFGSKNILKVGHHGSSESTSKELVQKYRFDEAVLSVGKNNRFGHPSQKTIDVLKSLGIKIRRTDVEGDIVYNLINEAI